MGKEYDYMQRAQDLIDGMDLNSDTEDIFPEIVRQADLIQEISEHVKGTQLFKGSSVKYDEYIKNLEADVEGTEKRVKMCFMDFLNKVIGAPTQMHLCGVVILVVPAIDYFIKQHKASL